MTEQYSKQDPGSGQDSASSKDVQAVDSAKAVLWTGPRLQDSGQDPINRQDQDRTEAIGRTMAEARQLWL
jgi:hypothetical protein